MTRPAPRPAGPASPFFGSSGPARRSAWWARCRPMCRAGRATSTRRGTSSPHRTGGMRAVDGIALPRASGGRRGRRPAEYAPGPRPGGRRRRRARRRSCRSSPRRPTRSRTPTRPSRRTTARRRRRGRSSQDAALDALTYVWIDADRVRSGSRPWGSLPDATYRGRLRPDGDRAASGSGALDDRDDGAGRGHPQLGPGLSRRAPPGRRR